MPEDKNANASLRQRSGGEGPWRCLFCHDILADGEDCPKDACKERQAAAERRMGMLPPQ